MFLLSKRVDTFTELLLLEEKIRIQLINMEIKVIAYIHCEIGYRLHYYVQKRQWQS